MIDAHNWSERVIEHFGILALASMRTDHWVGQGAGQLYVPVGATVGIHKVSATNHPDSLDGDVWLNVVARSDNIYIPYVGMRLSTLELERVIDQAFLDAITKGTALPATHDIWRY